MKDIGEVVDDWSPGQGRRQVVDDVAQMVTVVRGLLGQRPDAAGELVASLIWEEGPQFRRFRS